MIEINGKSYPLWSQFVEGKDKWVGGVLEDFGDSMDKFMGHKPVKTIITDVRLEPNGKESAYFTVVGEDFSCGFDVRHGGIGAGDDGYLTFGGYGGHSWRIKEV